MPQSLSVDRTGVLYRITFVAESGVECSNGQPANVLTEINGAEQAADFVAENLQREYETSDWLDPQAGYRQFVDQNENVLKMFRDGTISCAAFNVPYGTIVIG